MPRSPLVREKKAFVSCTFVLWISSHPVISWERKKLGRGPIQKTDLHGMCLKERKRNKRKKTLTLFVLKKKREDKKRWNMWEKQVHPNFKSIFSFTPDSRCEVIFLRNWDFHVCFQSRLLWALPKPFFSPLDLSLSHSFSSFLLCLLFYGGLDAVQIAVANRDSLCSPPVARCSIHKQITPAWDLWAAT